MVTRRGRSGLFVAAVAVSLALTSISSHNAGILQVEADAIKANLVGPGSLRGGQQQNVVVTGVTSRKLEDGQQQEQEDDVDENQEQQEQQAEEENVEEQQEEEVQEEENEEGPEEEENDMNYDYQNYDGQYGTSEMVDKVKDTAQGLMDRFDEDVVNMWSTSPSEWDDEFWKVFGIIAGVVTVVLSFIVYIFCCCCCGGSDSDDRDFLVATKSEADRRRSHRGRFIGRTNTGNTGETDTVGVGSYSERSNDWESPFVLIEDVEKDDNFGQDTVAQDTIAQDTLATCPGDTTSPVYGRGGISAMSGEFPFSANSTLGPGFSTRAVAHTQSKEIGYGASMDDNETQISNGKEIKENPSGGIINETLEVWSEFLGFKKSKYNMPPPRPRPQEDEDINLTDDERTRRSNRSRGSKSSKKKSSRKNGIPRPTNGARSSNTQLHGAGYTPSPANASPAAFVDESVAETPISSNASASARMTKVNSPRRTALLKTKNLLKSFGNNKQKPPTGNKRPDPKEETLLENSEINDEDRIA